MGTCVRSLRIKIFFEIGAHLPIGVDADPKLWFTGFVKAKSSVTCKRKAAPSGGVAKRVNPLHIRLHLDERRLIEEKAAEFGINVSTWVRHAAINYSPKKGEKMALRGRRVAE